MIEKVSTLGFGQTIKLIREGKAGVVLCCTLNEIMMAENDIKIREAMNRADILTPDGMPLVWYLRWKNGYGERVYGPDVMNEIVDKYDDSQLFIGDGKNKAFFEKKGLYIELPFKNNFLESDYKQIAKEIRSLKVKVIWVGLGARKQVLMADGLKRNGVGGSIVTVGAAFDFLSGQMVQAPKWIRNCGGEWVFRLVCEPKRLGIRYITIIRFMGWWVFRRLVGHKK